MNRLAHLSSLVRDVLNDQATPSEILENAQDLAEAVAPLLPLLVGWERANGRFQDGLGGSVAADRADHELLSHLRTPTDAPPVMAVPEPVLTVGAALNDPRVRAGTHWVEMSVYSDGSPSGQLRVRDGSVESRGQRYECDKLAPVGWGDWRPRSTTPRDLLVLLAARARVIPADEAGLRVELIGGGM